MIADPKPGKRIVEDRLGWEQLRRIKLKGGCRVCGATFLPQLHHLVPRSQGGDDVPDCLVPLCGPLVNDCHGKVEAWDIPTRARLRATLTEAEVGYCVAKKSADWLEHAYPSGPEPQTDAAEESAARLGDADPAAQAVLDPRLGGSEKSPSGPEHPPEQSSFAAPESARG